MSLPTWNFVGLDIPAWVDLPRFEEIQAAPYLGALASELARQLAAYHKLGKDQQENLGPRGAALQELAKFCLGLAAEPRLGFCFAWLAQLAVDKGRFLACLEQIFREGWHRPEKLNGYLDDHSDLSDRDARPLHLTRQRYMFPERSVFWGNYAMECLDPCHRQLPDLYRVWEEQLSSVPYLLWLEAYSSFRHERWVRYLSPEEQAEKQVVCQEGRLYTPKGRALSCPERQHFLFVIDLQGRLLVARAAADLCHASFTRGQAVLGSGILQAREGELVHLKFESGHYLSGPEEWWQSVQILQRLGVAWSEKLRVTVFDRYRYISNKVDQRAFSSLPLFKHSLGL